MLRLPPELIVRILLPAVFPPFPGWQLDLLADLAEDAPAYWRPIITHLQSYHLALTLGPAPFTAFDRSEEVPIFYKPIAADFMAPATAHALHLVLRLPPHRALQHGQVPLFLPDADINEHELDERWDIAGAEGRQEAAQWQAARAAVSADSQWFPHLLSDAASSLADLWICGATVEEGRWIMESLASDFLPCLVNLHVSIDGCSSPLPTHWIAPLRLSRGLHVKIIAFDLKWRICSRLSWSQGDLLFDGFSSAALESTASLSDFLAFPSAALRTLSLCNTNVTAPSTCFALGPALRSLPHLLSIHSDGAFAFILRLQDLTHINWRERIEETLHITLCFPLPHPFSGAYPLDARGRRVSIALQLEMGLGALSSSLLGTALEPLDATRLHLAIRPSAGREDGIGLGLQGSDVRIHDLVYMVKQEFGFMGQMDHPHHITFELAGGDGDEASARLAPLKFVMDE